MTAAIFGLVGVLVGGVIAAVGQYLLGVRYEYAAATVAARLIGAELNVLCAVVESGDLENRGVLETLVWSENRARWPWLSRAATGMPSSVHDAQIESSREFTTGR